MLWLLFYVYFYLVSLRDTALAHKLTLASPGKLSLDEHVPSKFFIFLPMLSSHSFVVL
jgi:hypothetical protein